MRILFCSLLAFLLFSCKEKKAAAPPDITAINYVLDTTWPQLGADFRLSQPTGIGVDGNDHIFVFHRAGRRWTEPFPDSLISENTVLEIDPETGKILHAWGAHYFIMPHGLNVDKDNNVWVTDVGLNQVFKFDHEGELLLTLGEAKVPGKDGSHFNRPTDVAVGSDGCFYVSDGYGNSRVAKFSPTGTFIKEWGSFGNRPGEFNTPHGISIDENNTLYVADRENNRLQLFDTSGRFIKEIKNDAAVEQLPSVTVDKTNHLLAIDYDPRKGADSLAIGSTIFQMDSTDGCSHRFGATATANRASCWFHDIAVDSKGNIYVGDITGLKILKFKPKK